MAKRRVQKRKGATARGKAGKGPKTVRAKATKRTVANAKPKRASVKKTVRKVKRPIAPVVETMGVELIERPAPGAITVSEAEETEVRKAS
jgi:hypothetical protein